MEIFTILRLAIFLFAVIAILTILLNILFGVDEPFGALGVIFMMVILSITLSTFFIQPEKFGYEKIISQEVE